MTKKHFESAARIVREHSGSIGLRSAIADAFADLFAAENPRFDRNRFRTACRLDKSAAALRAEDTVDRARKPEESS